MEEESTDNVATCSDLDQNSFSHQTLEPQEQEIKKFSYVLNMFNLQEEKYLRLTFENMITPDSQVTISQLTVKLNKDEAGRLMQKKFTIAQIKNKLKYFKKCARDKNKKRSLSILSIISLTLQF